MNKAFFILFLFFFNSSFAQEIIILDQDTKEPIQDVAIFNSDKSKTALTTFNGNADLSVFNKNERITLKHIGYQTKKTTKNLLLKRGKTIYLVLAVEELDGIVMSVSKWEQQKKDIPQKVVSISEKTIAFTNPQTAADLLQKSGKIFVQKSQLGGGSPMIRGFATNRLLITVDGVRMNNAIFRGGNLQNVIAIDPFSINNTEVIFGPGSVIYGSDAIGGVLNFYAKKPVFSKTEEANISGNTTYRFSTANSENTIHADINYGKQKWAFLTSVTYSDFDDLKMGEHGPDSYLRQNYAETINNEDALTINSNPKKQVTSGYNQINAMQKIAFKPNNNWNYELGLYFSETSDFSRYDRLIRPSKDETGLRSAEWYYGPQEWFMSKIGMQHQGKGKFYDRLKINAAYQHFGESRNDRDFGSTTLNTTEENVDAFSTNIDFENKRIGDLRLYYGLEYVFNKINSKGFETDTESKQITNAASRYPDNSRWQTTAGYINAEYKAKPNLTLLSGLRYSHVWINAEFDKTFYPFPFDDANLNTGALTGSIGLSWFPKESFQVTFNGSTGFRAPNIDDVGKIFDSEPGSVVVPNPDLEAEYAYNADLGIQKNFNDKVIIKGAVFYTYLVDALVRRDFTFNGETEIEYHGELSNVQAIQNAAKAYVHGFEFGVDAYFTEHLSLSSNLTFTKGIEEEEDGTESPGRHVAPTFGDVHLIWKNDKLKTDLFFNFNGEVSYNNLSSSERSKDYIYATDSNGNPYSPNWQTLNLHTSYQITNKIKATLGWENITNQRYRTYSSGIVAPGTNLISSISYQF
ncbi:TonB-dependent receptor plug domain-containing protein [Cellulophaga fucicola]|uniref:Hemoglobin/transferrin/lactoferrin receptor protein n=1 Tax=Cellulophaga fucicola TaxID=76595 RepID=A0A1K1PZS2_9FLAO|nr:TonB-dependent receptor [Cellulophaga fucicola]SFW53120.1 hemoglobin/transferrin/lactoferrin receptor protein [Cellulophaga fucicola]